jgi:hypothetical protein
MNIDNLKCNSLHMDELSINKFLHKILLKMLKKDPFWGPLEFEECWDWKNFTRFSLINRQFSGSCLLLFGESE